MRLQAALTVVAFGGLDGVTKDDRRGQQDRTGDQEDRDEGDQDTFEPEGESHHEECDGHGIEQIADAVGEKSPVGDASATDSNGVVVLVSLVRCHTRTLASTVRT